MKQVSPGLYIGDTSDATMIDRLVSKEIRLIVCAAKDHPCPFEGHFDYLKFPLLDDETDNVLLYVDLCFNTVSLNITSDRNVLIHCVQGVSRSVALVTAYIMRRDHLEFEEAYSVVAQSYPGANIADNFRAQLTEYGTIYSWDMSMNTQTHRLYRTRNRVSPATALVQPDDSQFQYRYLCRNCRECLFLDCHLVPSTWENYRIECMQWMSSQVDTAADGSLQCPRCGSKVGQFSWIGMMGEYDIPAFVMTKSRVDAMPLSSGFKGDPFPGTRY